MAETAWWIWSVSMRSSMTTVHDRCESSSSCHRRHTHRGLWLTGPDELSRGRLVRLQWECDGDGLQPCRSAPNELCLLCVQLQPIAGCPTRDVDDALRHVGLERAGIRQWEPAVNLGVICVQMRMQTVIGTDRLLTIGQVRIDGRTDRFAISYRASVCWRAIMTQDEKQRMLYLL